MSDANQRFFDLLESDQSDPQIQYELGQCYLTGEGVEQMCRGRKMAAPGSGPGPRRVQRHCWPVPQGNTAASGAFGRGHPAGLVPAGGRRRCGGPVSGCVLFSGAWHED